MLQRKAPHHELRPATSFDSAQTAEAHAHAHRGGTEQTLATAVAISSGVPAVAGAATTGSAADAAKQAIKEALAPLGPAQLALVQEQLRQSRLARQQEVVRWGGGGVGGAGASQPVIRGSGGLQQQQHSSSSTPAAAGSLLHASAESDDSSSSGSSNPLVQQVASALARGQVAAQDVKRVLSTLDPSVFLPVPEQQLQRQQAWGAMMAVDHHHHQQQQQHHHPAMMMQQQHQQPAWHEHQHQHQHHMTMMMSSSAPYSALSVPAGAAFASPVVAAVGPGPISPQPQLSFRHQQHYQQQQATCYTRTPRTRRAPTVSVAAPYSAVLNSLQLPPAALAAHAAAACAAAAAAEEAAAAAAAVAAGVTAPAPAQEGPACGAAAHHPGSASRKGLRTGRRARGQVGSLLRSVSTGSDDAAGHMSACGSAGPIMYADQHADDMLQMLAAEAGDSPAMVMHPAAAWQPAATTPATPAVAGYDHHAGAEASFVPCAPTSLQARFARLSPSVQAAILLELDQLSAMEHELRGGGDSTALAARGGAAEPQGPRRSGRTRKARNWGEAGFTSHNGSASPPPPGAEAGDMMLAAHHHHDDALYDVTADDIHYEPKRMRLDASSSSRLQFTRPPASASPDANSAARRHQQGHNSPDLEMLPALDLVGATWCPPDDAVVAAAEPAQEQQQQQQQPRRRRIPRKAGPRASARKSMHRRTFKRGKPQRAPVM